LEDLNDGQKTYWSVNGERRREIERTGTEKGNETMIAAGFMENLIRNHRDAPWFACFWPHSPHGPYHYLNRFEDTHQSDRPLTRYGEEDVENDPELLEGTINTPRERANAEDLRQRLETMRVSAGSEYRAAEN